MIRPDYRLLLHNSRALVHSAKGSTWEEHKYIKRIDGTYYYPDSYEGGRHLPKDKSDTSSDDKEVEIPEEEKKPRNPELELEDWEKTLYDKLFEVSQDVDTAAEFTNFRKMVKEFADEDFLERLSYTRGKEKEVAEELAKEKAEAEESGYDPDSIKRKSATEQGDSNALSTMDLTRYENFKKQLSKLIGKDEIGDDELKPMLEKIKFHYEDIAKATSLDEKDVESLANEVIEGHFGDEHHQKELLGSNYTKIKSRANAILKERERIEKAKKKAEEAAAKKAQAAAQKAATVSKSSTSSRKSSGGSSSSVQPTVSSTSSSGSSKPSTKKTKQTVASKGLNMNKVYEVYRKKR